LELAISIATPSPIVWSPSMFRCHGDLVLG
jgi:hypothetical protein